LPPSTLRLAPSIRTCPDYSSHKAPIRGGGPTRASRARFDTIWTDGYQRLKNRLGAPDLSGRHSTRWWHAVWRTGPRLLILAQGEDFASYSVYDAAYLAAIEYPEGADIPQRDWLYGLLVGRYGG